MKEYRKKIRIIYWMLLPIGAMGTLSVYFEEWFPWSTKLYLILCAVFLPVIVFSPLKYFCGIVSLRVTNKAIERVWMIFKTCTISRENLNVFYRDIYGKAFLVFSNSDLSLCSNFGILLTVLRRKAIIFPKTIEILVDFPVWIR